MATSQNTKWSSTDVSNITFSKPTTKKDGSREVYLSYDKSKLIIEAPKVHVKFFNANPNLQDASKMNYSISVACENPEFYEIFGTQLNSFIITEAVNNSSAWFGREKVREIIEDIYKPLYKEAKEGTDYPPMLTLKFYDNQVADMFIDKNNQPILAKDLAEVLARDTYINAIFKISSLNCTDTALRVRAELVRCRVIERGSSIRAGINISELDMSALKLGKLETLDLGGKRTRLIGKSGAVCLRLKGIRLAPYPVLSVNDKGEKMYSVNMILENDEHFGFLKSLDAIIKKELASRSVEFYGKKRSPAQVEGKFISQLHYSKKDKEEIASGKNAQYPPALKIKVMRDKEDSKYIGLSAVKPDEKPFEGDINEVIPKNRDQTYDIDITCRHIWFGKDGDSVGWVLNRIVVDDSGVVSGNIRFSDEDEDGEVSGDDVKPTEQIDEDGDHSEVHDSEDGEH
jgi:hypothetical protein